MWARGLMYGCEDRDEGTEATVPGYLARVSRLLSGRLEPQAVLGGAGEAYSVDTGRSVENIESLAYVPSHTLPRCVVHAWKVVGRSRPSLEWRPRPRRRISRTRPFGKTVSLNWLCSVDQRPVGNTMEAALEPWGSSSLGMKQEHQKDLRLRRITRCEVGRLAGTKSSVAASACRKCLTVVQESTPSVLKQILLMRVALGLPAPRMVVADSFTPGPGRVCGPDLASWPGFRGRGQGMEEEEGGACAFGRGMSVLPSASPMYSVCGNSPAAEAPASARSRRCPFAAVRDRPGRGRTQRGSKTRGVREDLNVFSSRMMSEKCLAGPSARIEHDE